MQNRKKGPLSKSLTKTKPSFLQPSSQRLIERKKTKERAGELAPLAVENGHKTDNKQRRREEKPDTVPADPFLPAQE